MPLKRIVCEVERSISWMNGQTRQPSHHAEQEQRVQWNAWGATLLVFTLGLTTSGAFMALGIWSALQAQEDQFVRSATDLANKIQSALEDYVNAAALIHNRCHSRNLTRQDFRELYEYLIAGALDFQAAQFHPFILHEERQDVESEAETYYSLNYPYINYRGIVEFQSDIQADEVYKRSKQEYYYPNHFVEPIEGNEAAIDLDYHATGTRRRTVTACVTSGMPAMTDRLRLLDEIETSAYGVVLMHPGLNLTMSSQFYSWPGDLSSIVIRIPDVLRRSAESQVEGAAAYLYDRSDTTAYGEPVFLGGVEIYPKTDGGEADLLFLSDRTYEDVQRNEIRTYHEVNVSAANKIWTVVVVPMAGTFEPEVSIVVLGGTIIFVSSVFIAIWVHLNALRIARFTRMRAEAEAEKARLVLDNAQQSAKAERDLNSFVAHEVRNPVSAAMAACSFVSAFIQKDSRVSDEAARNGVKNDLDVIETSLNFINDLLRTMLDMHRTTDRQLEIHMTPTNILHDVLEPVCSIICHRNVQQKVIVNCPASLVVMTDRLRLRQVIINLGRNSTQFVETGTIKLCAQVVDGYVQLSVEDSGPGIPSSKRDRLFCKYQESLDMLCQGTGISMFLCKNLVDLMGGEIFLDETFDSGVPGNPGCRFVVNLKQPLIENEPSETTHGVDEDSEESVRQLPDELSVMFVDDDPILRKLFSRMVKKVAPRWSLRDAPNGETALQITDKFHFDLIFMDMYMASTEKQLLGSETVMALREKGVDCRICGLSANDTEAEFLEAGADMFLFKPIPCKPVELKEVLSRILFSPSLRCTNVMCRKQNHSDDSEEIITVDE